MSTEQRKSALVRLGYFGEASYTSIGEPYDNKGNKDERALSTEGLQLLATVSKKGKYSMINGYFDSQYNAVGCGVGCPYTTLDKVQAQENLAKKKLQISDNPWKPANPSKKAGGTGLGNRGSHYGTVNYIGVKTPAFPFGGRIEYVPQGTMEKLKKGDVHHDPPNIVTNPVKKGGFGFANNTIGVPHNAGERRNWIQQSCYFYAADPYDGAREKRKEEREKGSKNVSDAPFRPASYAFHGGPGRWVGTKVGDKKSFGGQINPYPEWVADPYMEPKKRRVLTEAEASREPFRPSNPSKKAGPGLWATLGTKKGGLMHKYPEYKEDFFGNRQLLEKEERKKYRELQEKMNRPAFSATVPAQPRSTRTVSIFKMNIKI